MHTFVSTDLVADRNTFGYIRSMHVQVLTMLIADSTKDDSLHVPTCHAYIGMQRLAHMPQLQAGVLFACVSRRIN